VTFRSGVKVVHQDRPEWGVGVVLTALRAGSDGATRLRVRFERAGLKTLSVPPAAIQAVDSIAPAESRDRLAGLDDAAATEAMVKLPEAVRDPFSSLEDRVAATLTLYRFAHEGGSLIDWASTQSGLVDPLTRFTRQSLEEMFTRFARLRDDHLKELVRESRKDRLETIVKVAQSASPAARTALRKLIGA
jgi:Protein of unknown function (DUF3553)